MKKITLLLVAFSIAGLNFSCKKEQEDVVTKTTGISLAAGQTYTTRVTYSGEGSNPMIIVKQASHAEVSEVTPITGSRDVTFTYKPVANYTGTDEVRISSNTSENNSGGGGQGHCSGHGETAVYVYQFTVTGNNH